MNIAYINHYAGSLKHGMEYRPYYLAKEWVKAGHDVRIIAASFSHVRSRQPNLSSAVTHEVVDGVPYVWLRTPDYDSNGPARFFNMLVFCLRLVWHAREILAGFRPDIVIASSTYPMDIFPARSLAKRAHAKLVYEVHDLWPLSPIELGGMSPHHPFIQLMQCSEDFAYRNADHVVSLLPLAGDYMRSRGLQNGKFVYIPNGICFEEWEKPAPPARDLVELVRSWKAEGCFVLAYAGAHGLANSLLDLVEAANLLSRKVRIVLIGDGLEKKSLQQKAAGLPNLHFHPPILKEQIPATLREFDALYIGLKNNAMFRFGISPNKLLDYMAVGRPILNAIKSGNDPVQEAAAGLTVPPGNPQKIATGIEQLMRLSPVERQKMGENGRHFVRENHDYVALARRFLREV